MSMGSRRAIWNGKKYDRHAAVPTALTAEMALRIHKAFGPDVDHLLRMQVAYEVAQVRKRSKDIKVKRYVAKAA